MATCLQPVDIVHFAGTTGATRVTHTVFVPVNPQPADVSGCSYVLNTGAEFVGAFRGLSPFVLDNTAAVQIGGAILSLWAVAWVVRTLAGMFFPKREIEE